MSTIKLRKKLLIYPRFQLTLIGINSLILGIMFTLISLQVSQVMRVLGRTGADLHLDSSHPYFQFLKIEANLLNTYLAWGFFVSAGISSLAILFVSHRVAGPMVRLGNYLKKIPEEGGGPLTPLQFRKGDFFSDLPPLVNSALKSVLDTKS